MPEGEIAVRPDAGVLNADTNTAPSEGECGMFKSKWGALDNYECPKCCFRDLRKEAAEEQRAACGLPSQFDQGDS